MRESQRTTGRGVSQGCAAPCCPLPWDGVGAQRGQPCPAGGWLSQSQKAALHIPSESGINKNWSKIYIQKKKNQKTKQKNPLCKNSTVIFHQGPHASHQTLKSSLWISEKNDLTAILQTFPSSLRAQQCLQQSSRWIWSPVATCAHVHQRVCAHSCFSYGGNTKQMRQQSPEHSARLLLELNRKGSDAPNSLTLVADLPEATNPRSSITLSTTDISQIVPIISISGQVEEKGA